MTDDDHHLADLVKKLTEAVELLSDRFRRKRISDAVLAVVVAIMLLAGLWYFFVELPDRRAETRNKIRDLACYAVRLRPPGYSVASDDLRKRYGCPPFDPAVLPSGAPTVAPSPGATVTRSVPGPTRTVTATPTPTPRPGAAGPAPTATRTVTVTAPRPAAETVTRRVTATTTVTRGVCLPLLCRTETP